MESIVDNFKKSYDAITAKVQGGAPRNQILFGAIILTIWQTAIEWQKQENPNG